MMLTATDPTRGIVLREVAPADRSATDAILERSAAAYAVWRGWSFEQRGEVLRAVARRMEENIEQLAMLMTEEMGKPIKEARGEVRKSAWCAEHYAEHAAAYLADQEIGTDATRSYVRHPPLGPTLGIFAWNAPFWLAFRYCAPALMAGNSCVIKHDPHVPACGAAIEELFRNVGAPDDILLNLPIATADAEAVIRDRRIRAVSFTGSSRGGAAVAAVAASEIKPHVLELGGSDPCIVLADADLEQAADVITLSRIINAGQSCIAVKRILAEASIHDRLVELLRERLAALKVGDPREESTDIGPIAREDLRENLHRQVRESIEAGATCVLGGELPDGPGYFYPVTLLTGVTNGMAVCREETFGPVASVLKVKSADEAVRLANETEYGLAASIWTGDAQAGEAMSRRIEAGQVVVNGIVKTDPRLPSGGVKCSGYGRELGPHGIHAFVNAQQIWIGPKRG